jgi:hypothetical protein
MARRELKRSASSRVPPANMARGERPQMLHQDFRAAGLGAGHDRALQIGARLLADECPEFRVYADPADHPFCLDAVPPADRRVGGQHQHGLLIVKAIQLGGG